MPRIYTPQALNTGLEIILEEQSSHHLAKVLRAKIGDELQLFNGDGLNWQSRITNIDKKHVRVTMLGSESNHSESPLKTHLAIAVSKGDRMDFVMQKATELGINAITPLLSERTEVKLNAERLEKKQQHWQQICIAACEQSGRSCIPTLHPLQHLRQWLVTLPSAENDSLKLLLHPHQNSTPLPQKLQSVMLLIGPEGGFSEEEAQQALLAEFQPWQLGKRILRTETAPLAALSIVQHRWGDLG